MRNQLPWEMRRRDFIPFTATRPQPRYEPVVATSYSEGALHRASVENRNREVEPPVVPVHPTGSWMIHGEHIYHLRELPVESLHMIEHGQNRNWVNKYADWLLDGSMPPPIRVMEKRDGTFAITNGHHRYLATRQIGLPTICAWVGYSIAKRYRSGVYPVPLTYLGAVIVALRNALPVEPDVIRDALGLNYLSALATLPATMEMDRSTRNLWMVHTELENVDLIYRKRLRDNTYYVRPKHDATLIFNALGI